MSDQLALFPDVAPTSNPAADLPLVVCGNSIPGRGCAKFMAWVVTERGTACPIDPEPVPDGNLVFVEGAPKPTIRYLHKGETVPEGTARFKSHFATCPKASEFRRKPA